jgi:anti-sigma factor RsiW
MTDHVAWDALNDYADGVLDETTRSAIEVHLAACRECRGRLEEMEVLVREVSRLPREFAPPVEAWASIREEVERRKVVSMPGAAGRRPAHRNWSQRPWLLAAAALVLMVSSSAVTALYIRRGELPPAVASNPPSLAMPVALLDVERGYVTSVKELAAALDAARPNLAPGTIQIVERNLAVIDAAIAESREALLRDPGNRVLQDVLAGSYRQKLDLLRRAAQLAAS